MHDPNRDKDRGDPNVEDTQESGISTREAARAIAEGDAATRGASATDAADPAWSGSNPGLTGDATPDDAGTNAVGAGSGAGSGAGTAAETTRTSTPPRRDANSEAASDERTL